MHSSIMRTVRSSSRLLGGGVSGQVGCLPGGLPGGYTEADSPPVNRMTDRQV